MDDNNHQIFVNAISKYGKSESEFKAALGKAEIILNKLLASPTTFLFMNAGVGNPVGELLFAQNDRADANNWPTADTIQSMVINLHQLGKEVLLAWNRLPAQDKGAYKKPIGLFIPHIPD